MLPPLALGCGAGMEAKEEQEEDGPWGRPVWAQLSALPALDKSPVLSV